MASHASHVQRRAIDSHRPSRPVLPCVLGTSEATELDYKPRSGRISAESPSALPRKAARKALAQFRGSSARARGASLRLKMA